MGIADNVTIKTMRLLGLAAGAGFTGKDSTISLGKNLMEKQPLFVTGFSPIFHTLHLFVYTALWENDLSFHSCPHNRPLLEASPKKKILFLAEKQHFPLAFSINSQPLRLIIIFQYIFYPILFHVFWNDRNQQSETPCKLFR